MSNISESKFCLRTKDLILRDFIESDIERRIHWETTETEWQLWDAPWETEGLTAAEKQEELKSYVAMLRTWPEKYRNMPAEQRRWAFQIVTQNEPFQYIGWVSAYGIDESFSYANDGKLCAVGIDIPELSAWGKGYGVQALCAFIQYCLDQGEPEIYTQTWSGNERMIRLAQKIGFEECCRKPGIRTVRGKQYDGLTFRLNREKFEAFIQ